MGVSKNLKPLNPQAQRGSLWLRRGLQSLVRSRAVESLSLSGGFRAFKGFSRGLSGFRCVIRLSVFWGFEV